MSLNKAILIGHCGQDPEMFQFENGGMIAKISLATNETYTNKETNEKIKTTEWHRLIFRNKAAEIIEKYVKKGDQLYIEGKITTRKWTDTSQVERYTTEIVVRDFKMLTPKGESSSSRQPEPPIQNPDDHDDLPF